MDQEAQKRHRATIVDQFSRQAIPFTKVAGHLEAMQVLMELSRLGATDDVLDVACGPGLVACDFALHAARVTGVDITPAMIAQAQKRQREMGLQNVAWVVGEATPLPFPDDSFSLVVTRYSFHHFLAPERALAEMIRVCRPGGRVLVADVAMAPEKAEAYDRLELIRDPSHTHALTHEEFGALFARSGLADCRRSAYGVEMELEAVLKASFPNPGDEPKLREMIVSDIGVDRLGIAVRREGERVRYTVPVGVYVGWKNRG